MMPFKPTKTINFCAFDHMPCYVGAGTNDAHFRCGTSACPRPSRPPSSETPAYPMGAISDKGKDTRDEQTASLLSRLKEAEDELANLREWRWSFDPLTLTHAMVVGLLAEVNDNDAGRDLAETLEAVRDNLTVAARDLQAAQARIKVLEGELFWISKFANVRSEDRGPVTVRVAKGAFRTIRDRARSALPQLGEVVK